MSAATILLLAKPMGAGITVVSDPTVNVAPVVGATPDVTPAVWSSGASDTQRWEMADTDAGPWSTVDDMPAIDTPYTDQTFGKVLRWVEAQGAVTAESAATGAVDAYIAAATITPTLGAEIIQNGDMSSATGWTAGTGWAIGSGVATGTATTALLRNTGATITINTWYRMTFDLVTRTGGSVWAFFSDSDTLILNVSTPASYMATERLRVSVGKPTLSGSGSFSGTVDNFSMKPMTFSTLLYGIANGALPRVIRAKVTRIANTQAGVMLRADDSNFILAVIQGNNNIRLSKNVGGTYTIINTVAATYSAGAVLELNYDPTAHTVTVIYNGVTVVNAASVTDTVFETAAGARLFSTHESNSFADIEASVNP